MSSPTEPSHGAPNTPQHGGLPIARDDDQYKAPRKIAALRAISTSLLTRALASAKSPISADPIQNTLDDTAEGLANLDLAPKQAEEQTNKLGLSQTSGEFEKMATTVAALPNAMSAFGLQPNTSWLSTRGTSGQPDYRMTSSRNFVKNRPRGTSLERTQKEKRVQEQPKGNYTTNPGDTALPPLPTPTKSGALSTISNNPPTDGVRARYRSWRDAHPPLGEEKAWSIGKGGSHDHQEGKVEKSVAEALAGIEPNNRSRKASHSLRFFREGLPEEKTKKKEKGRGRSSEKTAQLKDFQPGNDAIILENEELHISRGTNSPPRKRRVHY